MEFKRPNQSFHFEAQLDSPAAHQLQIWPVFTEDEPEELASEIQKPELSELLKKQRALGSFEAKAGQVLNLAEQGLILGGLGKCQSWHPEKACELFRLLGARLVSLKDISLEFILRQRLVEALRKHHEQKDSFASLLDLDLQRQPQSKELENKKKTKKKDKQDDAEEKAEPIPDYISDLKLDDLICQLAVCMNLGAEIYGIIEKVKIQSPKHQFLCSCPGILRQSSQS